MDGVSAELLGAGGLSSINSAFEHFLRVTAVTAAAAAAMTSLAG